MYRLPSSKESKRKQLRRPAAYAGRQSQGEATAKAVSAAHAKRGRTCRRGRKTVPTSLSQLRATRWPDARAIKALAAVGNNPGAVLPLRRGVWHAVVVLASGVEVRSPGERVVKEERCGWPLRARAAAAA